MNANRQFSTRNLDLFKGIIALILLAVMVGLSLGGGALLEPGWGGNALKYTCIRRYWWALLGLESRKASRGQLGVGLDCGRSLPACQLPDAIASAGDGRRKSCPGPLAILKGTPWARSLAIRPL